MKILKSSLFILATLFSILYACDPCTDCGPAIGEPTVQLEFVNGEGANDLIERVQIVNTGLDTVFEDGVSAYITPLHSTSEETELNITIATTQYSLILTYDLFDEVDIDHRVLRRAKNISVMSHTFESFLVTCDTVNFDCDKDLYLDKETIITCYF